jgi:metal-responsive CopG/Arc/MetJ family transcriptional regulator
MKRIVTASELFKEDEYEIIFLPESLCEEIDEVIKQTNSYNDRDEFVSSAVGKFISEVSEDKIKINKKTD